MGKRSDKAGSVSGDEESPCIIKLVLTRDQGQLTRRDLFRTALAGGIAALATPSATGCGNSEVDIQVDSRGNCRCHAVCVCDTEESDSKSTWESQRSETEDVCTCNTVCTCDTVCVCNSDSDDPGSGPGYWYPN